MYEKEKDTQRKGTIQASTRLCEAGSEEARQRGREVAEAWAKSRLSYRQRER